MIVAFVRVSLAVDETIWPPERRILKLSENCDAYALTPKSVRLSSAPSLKTRVVSELFKSDQRMPLRGVNLEAIEKKFDFGLSPSFGWPKNKVCRRTLCVFFEDCLLTVNKDHLWSATHLNELNRLSGPKRSYKRKFDMTLGFVHWQFGRKPLVKFLVEFIQLWFFKNIRSCEPS